MKLELKHLAGYLPYGLKILDFKNGGNSLLFDTYELKPFNIHRCLTFMSHTEKPILRPLSDLTKEIEVNGKKFVPLERLNKYKSVNLIKVKNTKGEIEVFNGSTTNLRFFEYCIVEKLLEWHFDIYGLIEKDLAIDINTLK